MRRLGVGLLALTVVGCKTIHHDPALAARAALDYGTIALVQGDVERSYTLLADELKTMMPSVKYRDVIATMHPASRPVSLIATEFEPVPGQEMMQIFLYGQNGVESFYYRIGMHGTGSTGYKVAGIFRGSGPYPASKLRQKL